MLKKTCLILLAIVISGINLYSQNNDQLSLKNGSIIRGHIVKIIPNEKVTINDMAGNTWVFAMDEIKSIEEIPEIILQQEDGFSAGWVNMTSIGFLIGSQSSRYIAPFSLQTSIGYRNNMGIYTGVLTGLEFINLTHIPLMADFQYTLQNGNVTPVIIARGGYTFPTKGTDEIYGTTHTYYGGVTGSLGAGLKIRGKDHFAWDISIHYRYMQINYVEKYDWQTYDNTYKDIYNRLELRLGVYFGK